MRNTEKVIGYRETLKMLKKGFVERIVLARDTDEPIKEKILEAAKAKAVPVEMVESKTRLGQSCGIERAAAVVAYLMDGVTRKTR